MDIFIELGCYIFVNYVVLVVLVLELFLYEYNEKFLKIKESNNLFLIDEMLDLFVNINEKNVIEYLYDSFDYIELLFMFFDLGYIDLIDRSNIEVLVYLIVKKVV